ncbi:hypothetical protein F3Y22_tig00003507pilonHSYRG00096 [Hibiscus syriacus]|uniref:AP180 N-terminal homology (ANTH) domain-containing protein n=1 Tax=Hibiscus syriacus TaxID=106335 RepID=A0A6A3CLK5_HIBSY|nr:hypothetical protein F3Y22_tig00003507pilonHSYRG00096 [Hibiscus syriacus]
MKGDVWNNRMKYLMLPLSTSPRSSSYNSQRCGEMSLNGGKKILMWEINVEEILFAISQINPTKALVIANLKPFMSKCIVINQCAFVPERIIYDNFHVGYELIHYLKGSKNDSNATLKLDMEKTYDRGLSILLNDIHYKGMIKGDCASVKGPWITHLFYADDSLIFFKNSMEEAQKIKSILSTYKEASGQKINYEKLIIYFINNTRWEHRDNILKIFAVTEKEKLSDYLGMPLVMGKGEINRFRFVRNKIAKPRQGWTKNLLSFGGREVFHKTKREVGLGFRDLKLVNVALLGLLEANLDDMPSYVWGDSSLICWTNSYVDNSDMPFKCSDFMLLGYQDRMKTRFIESSHRRIQKRCKNFLHDGKVQEDRDVVIAAWNLYYDFFEVATIGVVARDIQGMVIGKMCIQIPYPFFIKLVNCKEDMSIIRLLLNEARGLLASNNGLKVFYVNHEANRAAHSLAQLTLSNLNPFSFYYAEPGRDTLILNLSDFGFSTFVPTNALYINERLDYKILERYEEKANKTTLAYDAELEEENFDEENVRKTTHFRSMKTDSCLNCNRVVATTLYQIVKESFQLYYDITEILAIFIDCFVELDLVESLNVYDYPEIEKITQKKLNLIDEFIRDKNFAAQQIENGLPKNEPKAVEEDDVKVVEGEAPVEQEKEDDSKDQAEKFALAFFDGGSPVPRWKAYQDEAEWESVLVQTSRNLYHLGGGFDVLMLDGMYQQGQTMKTMALAATEIARSRVGISR